MRALLTFGAGLLIFGPIFVVLGFKERSIASASSAVPEEVSLKTLIARGPNGNPNITLKDFVLCDNLVFQSKGGVGSWSSVWVPVVPSDSLPPGQLQGGKPVVVQALMFTTNARNEQELNARCAQPRVRALVTNKIASLGSKQRELLQQSYPGTDFDNCLIIQEGREPAGPAKQILMLAGGSVGTLVGLGLLGFAFYMWRKEQAQPTRKRKLKRVVDDDDDEDDDEPRPIRRSVARDDDDDRPRRPNRRVERDEDDDDRPRRPKRRSRDDD